MAWKKMFRGLKKEKPVKPFPPHPLAPPWKWKTTQRATWTQLASKNRLKFNFLVRWRFQAKHFSSLAWCPLTQDQLLSTRPAGPFVLFNSLKLMKMALQRLPFACCLCIFLLWLFCAFLIFDLLFILPCVASLQNKAPEV